MATKLQVFNDALLLLGETKLASLTENREARHALDDTWTGRVTFCLERGFWNFAMRTVELSASESAEPVFGFTYAFVRPSDWVRTYQIADNEGFDPQLTSMHDEGGYLFADVDPVYLRFVSDDTSYGFNVGEWPQSFVDCVAASLALQNCYRITGSDNRRDRLELVLKKAFALARSNDAMNEPPAQLPYNSWVRSRGDNFRGNRDRLGGPQE